MPGWVVVVVVGVLIFAIAAVVVGREARRLDAIAPRAVYIDDQAVDYVAEYLPPSVQERVTVDELWSLMRAHLNWLHAKGLLPDRAVDQRQELTGHPVVMEETTATGYLIGVAEAEGIDVDDAAVAAILDGHLRYLDAIGAVGPVADDPEALRPELGRGERPIGELPPG